jgi:wobble nucleotide-excising tRNase
VINSLHFIQGVGQFEQAAGGQQVPLAKLTVVYAENGRGKTTLSAILRSLGTGEALPVAERRRLPPGANPRVVINCDGAAAPAVFENNIWSRTVPDITIFDDIFVDRNVYSGLTVEPAHRQRLHELILGGQGVMLNQRLKDAIAEVTARTLDVRARALAIPDAARPGMTVDQFCALEPMADVEQAIRNVERDLLAANQQAAIREGRLLDAIALPAIDLAAIRRVLEQDFPALDLAAATRVQEHFRNIGAGGERWVADGIPRVPAAPVGHASPCPFCAQDLGDSPLIAHYRAYFGEGYARLKQIVDAAIANLNAVHSGNAPAAFERAVRILIERLQFWARFRDVPEVNVDTAAITEAWRTAHTALATALALKQGVPLERVELTEASVAAVAAYEEHRAAIDALNQQLGAANVPLRELQAQVDAGNRAALDVQLGRFHAIRARAAQDMVDRCTAYRAALEAKTRAEQGRDAARQALDHYRDGVFPASQASINEYLGRFGAGFRLRAVSSANIGTGSVCNYDVLINNIPVAVAGGQVAPGAPSFRNTLSAGDRTTLALSFFLTSLDRDPNLANKVVVIDDPISSLDDHRAMTTVQEIQRLVGRTGQVIVLSHNKPFLCSVWEDADRAASAGLAVERVGAASDLRPWNVEQDSISAHDHRHSLFREYLENGGVNRRDVAQALRPTMEAFLRVAYPERFPPGTRLGPFRGTCQNLLGTPNEILDATDVQELGNLIQYANLFHHDTNAADWQTVAINDGQLETFVRRTLAFARR